MDHGTMPWFANKSNPILEWMVPQTPYGNNTTSTKIKEKVCWLCFPTELFPAEKGIPIREALKRNMLASS